MISIQIVKKEGGHSLPLYSAEKLKEHLFNEFLRVEDCEGELSIVPASELKGMHQGQTDLIVYGNITQFYPLIEPIKDIKLSTLFIDIDVKFQNLSQVFVENGNFMVQTDETTQNATQGIEEMSQALTQKLGSKVKLASFILFENISKSQLATLRNPSAQVLASDFTLEDLLNGISFQLGSRSIHAYSPKTVQPDQLLEV